ncbi:hypothetical protein BKA80DRAFT_309684 [Phyllosticta citrichinensis]
MSGHTCQTRAHKSAPPAATSEKVVRYHREGDITPPEYEDAIQDPPVYYDGSTPTRAVVAATTHDQPQDPAPAPSYGCRSSCTAEHACRGKLLEQYMAVDVMLAEEEEEEEKKEEEEDETEGESESEAEEWRRLHGSRYVEIMIKYIEKLEREEQRREEQLREEQQQ